MITATRKRWHVAPPAPAETLAQLNDLHPLVAQVLFARGYDQPDAALRFLQPDLATDSPFLMKGIHGAIDRIRRAIKQGEAIVVYGDFDADGVTATALLSTALRLLGANVRPYIPHRVDEGYGLNVESLRALADEGTDLVVTVDCGIRSVEEVAAANGFGLEMVITDHHSVGPELPPAVAVVNPQQADCRYPEKRLAGVGVAYKLAEALHTVENKIPLGKGVDWHPDQLLDLVALGTVSDIVPLVGENRALVQRGLDLLRNTKREGLVALYKAAGVRPDTVSAATIGFSIGPRINAAGRLQHANLALEMLTAETLEEASEKARRLDALNKERQELTEAMVQLAFDAGSEPGATPLIFAAHHDFLPGIVGLVASRLKETYYLPAVIVEKGDSVSHGSCRSIPEFHITHALDRCADLLVRHGGHAAAAGFTVENDAIEPLAERLTELAEAELGGQELMPTLEIDGAISLADLEWVLLDELARLEPTGEQNPPPMFCSYGVQVASHRTVGGEGQHLKLTLAQDGHKHNAIGFRLGHWEAEMPEAVDVAYYFEKNEWNGMVSLQLNVQDLRPAERI